MECPPSFPAGRASAVLSAGLFLAPRPLAPRTNLRKSSLDFRRACSGPCGHWCGSVCRAWVDGAVGRVNCNGLSTAQVTHDVDEHYVAYRQVHRAPGRAPTLGLLTTPEPVQGSRYTALLACAA